MAIAAGLALTFPFLRDAAARPSDGFIAYYTAARLVLSGQAEALYDDAQFREATRTVGVAADDIYYVNPPTTSLVLVPLASLSYIGARTAWTVLSVGLLLAAGGWTAWRLRLGGWRLVALAVLPFYFEPLAANFEHGQVYVLVLAALVLARDAFRSDRSRSLGATLALLLLVKLAAAPLWLILAARRQWKPLAWALGASAAMILVTIPLIPAPVWIDFLKLLASIGGDPGLASPAYQSVPGLFRQVSHFDPAFSTAPWIENPRLGSLVGAVVVLGMFAATLVVTRRSANLDCIVAAAVALSVVVSPLSADYHYTILLLPVALLLARTRSLPGIALLAIAVWLIAADLAPRNPTPSYATFGGYARLLGGLLVWAQALATIYSRRHSSVVVTPEPVTSLHRDETIHAWTNGTG